MDNLDIKAFEDIKEAKKQKMFIDNFNSGLNLLNIIYLLSAIEENNLSYNEYYCLMGIEEKYQIFIKDINSGKLTYVDYNDINDLLNYMNFIFGKISKKLSDDQKQLFFSIITAFSTKNKEFCSKNVIDFLYELCPTHKNEIDSTKGIIFLSQIKKMYAEDNTKELIKSYINK